MTKFLNVTATAKLVCSTAAIETSLPCKETRMAIDEATQIIPRATIWNVLASSASSAGIMAGDAIMMTLKEVGVSLDESIYGD